MEIQKVQDAKKLLENTIFLAVANAMEKFQAETGMSPSSIDVRLHEIITIGYENPKRVVAEVVADIRL